MAVRVKFDTRGGKDLEQLLARLRAQYPGATAAAVYIEAIQVMRRSRALVPVDTSELKNSEYVTLPDPASADPRAEMGYTAPYALAVHERTELRHPNGGQANYLRQPFNEAVAGYAQRLAGRILQFVKRGINAPSPDSEIPTSPRSAEQLLSRIKKHLKRQGRHAEAARARVHAPRVKVR